MELRDLLKLIRRSYEATTEIPRFYRDFFSFLNVVNQNLSECGEPLMDEESLKYIILSNYKKAKFIENYQFDNEDKNLHYSSPLALYISYQPQLSEEHIQKYQKDICGAIVNSNLNEDNWYTLDYLVQVMKYLGINYKDLGFLRITDFLYEVFPEYQSKKDGNTDYGYIEATRYAEKTENRTIDIPLSNKKTKKKKSIDILSEFACFPGENFYSAYLYAIRQLAQMALPEHWYYGHNDPGTYPILRNYFLMTFIRVQSEKKILKNENYAVLNTGLVDKLYEPIYAFFKKNCNISPRSPQPWIFLEFVGSQDRNRQTLTREFGTELPAPAHYYNSTSELVFNIKSDIGAMNWNHLFDHCERFPESFLQDNGPNFDWSQPRCDKFYKDLSDAIKNDSRAFNRLKNRIEDAIKFAKKRVLWNFKTAIPIYYPKQKAISLLLPLALCQEDKIDVALVLETTESGAYIAHTILTLQMAYSTARLITRPDSDWLTADAIDGNEEKTDDYEDEDNKNGNDSCPVHIAENARPSFNENEKATIEKDDEGNLHVGNIIITAPFVKEGDYIRLDKITKNNNITTNKKYPYYGAKIWQLKNIP